MDTSELSEPLTDSVLYKEEGNPSSEEKNKKKKKKQNSIAFIIPMLLRGSPLSQAAKSAISDKMESFSSQG
ncbi:hypothetical protein LT330_007686 [Penicillium expansum]|nr:hypothetical protein LT330_007686 [Penicillium expansum]